MHFGGGGFKKKNKLYIKNTHAAVWSSWEAEKLIEGNSPGGGVLYFGAGLGCVFSWVLGFYFLFSGGLVVRWELSGLGGAALEGGGPRQRGAGQVGVNPDLGGPGGLLLLLGGGGCQSQLVAVPQFPQNGGHPPLCKIMPKGGFPPPQRGTWHPCPVCPVCPVPPRPDRAPLGQLGPVKPLAGGRGVRTRGGP